jgi:hypothetical protein
MVKITGRIKRTGTGSFMILIPKALIDTEVLREREVITLQLVRKSSDDQDESTHNSLVVSRYVSDNFRNFLGNTYKGMMISGVGGYYETQSPRVC